MLEIRIHGRGGQGNVVAAYLLAGAAFAAGRHCQAFPSFGAERRGAPVAAFVRVGDAPIRHRCQVRAPDFLIVQDPTLLHLPATLAGLKPGGGVLVNATQTPALPAGAEVGRLLALPATQLAREHLGRPVPNTALLAAFLSLTGLFGIEHLIETLAERFRGAMLEKNQGLVMAAAGAVPAGTWQLPEVGHAG